MITDLEERKVSTLKVGDNVFSYGVVTAIKRGVIRWTLTFDSNAIVHYLPDDETWVTR